LKERLHHQTMSLTARVEETEAELEAREQERSTRRREMQTIVDSHERMTEGLKRELNEVKTECARLQKQVKDADLLNETSSQQLAEARDGSVLLLNTVKEGRREQAKLSEKLQMQQAVIESTLHDISQDAEFEAQLVSSVSGLLDRMMRHNIEMI